MTDFPKNEQRTPGVRTLRLEGRDFGYHSASIGLWDTVFLWIGLKRWLSAWAVGFEVSAGSLMIFIGPIAFAVGLVDRDRALSRFLKSKYISIGLLIGIGLLFGAATWFTIDTYKDYHLKGPESAVFFVAGKQSENRYEIVLQSRYTFDLRKNETASFEVESSEASSLQEEQIITANLSMSSKNNTPRYCVTWSSSTLPGMCFEHDPVIPAGTVWRIWISQ
jgi:hypothetical protein